MTFSVALSEMDFQGTVEKLVENRSTFHTFSAEKNPHKNALMVKGDFHHLPTQTQIHRKQIVQNWHERWLVFIE